MLKMKNDKKELLCKPSEGHKSRTGHLSHDLTFMILDGFVRWCHVVDGFGDTSDASTLLPLIQECTQCGVRSPPAHGPRRPAVPSASTRNTPHPGKLSAGWQAVFSAVAALQERHLVPRWSSQARMDTLQHTVQPTKGHEAGRARALSDVHGCRVP